jgi:hypothetical protein
MNEQALGRIVAGFKRDCVFIPLKAAPFRRAPVHDAFRGDVDGNA